MHLKVAKSIMSGSDFSLDAIETVIFRSAGRMMLKQTYFLEFSGMVHIPYSSEKGIVLVPNLMESPSMVSP